jgi:hypothetical protein
MTRLSRAYYVPLTFHNMVSEYKLIVLFIVVRGIVGRAIAQAARVRGQVRSCWICGG